MSKIIIFAIFHRFSSNHLSKGLFSGCVKHASWGELCLTPPQSLNSFLNPSSIIIITSFCQYTITWATSDKFRSLHIWFSKLCLICATFCLGMEHANKLKPYRRLWWLTDKMSQQFPSMRFQKMLWRDPYIVHVCYKQTSDSLILSL